MHFVDELEGLYDVQKEGGGRQLWRYATMVDDGDETFQQKN